MTKRERLDSAVDVEPLDTNSSVHVIRSHRRPRAFHIRINPRRISAALLVLLMLSPTVFVQASSLSTPTQTTPMAAPSVAPMVFPDAPYVPPTPAPDKPRTDAVADFERASRGMREPKPVAPPKPTNRVETAVQFALAQQGDRYVWAASGPNSYDCSGLVLRAFAQIGINLPHFTGTMINRGVRVNRNQMIRGDVVFPSSGHVGIYLGDGMMVHASSSEGRVVVAEVYSFYAARRLV